MCCKFLFGSDLLTGGVFDDLTGLLVYKTSLSDIFLPSDEVFVLNGINERDLLIRRDIGVFAVNSGSRSDLRHIVCNGLQIHESVL